MKMTKIKISGFFGQLRILLWKNIILSRRNKSGTIAEILCPIGFLLVLLLMRYLIDRIVIGDQPQVTINPIDSLKIYNFTTTSGTITNTLLFYPNSTLVESILSRAVTLIQSRNINFNHTIKPSIVADGTMLSSNEINYLTALFTFPENYTNALPNNVEYSIYTQE
jgi:hypothetical protein